ncbi:MAG: hypothetical protein EP341_09260 [Sphingomonadales bacterium]|nr:MAG: hypothetical protein EP341_09260 [Sphingomonadales bacterium]
MTGFRSKQLQMGRGRPLAMLVVVLSLWIGARLLLWESPFSLEQTIGKITSPRFVAADAPVRASDSGLEAGKSPGTPGTAVADSYLPNSIQPMSEPRTPLIWQTEPSPPMVGSASIAAAHQLVWMAAMSHLPVPQELTNRFPGPRGNDRLQGMPLAGVKRWSFDGWALWREGSGRSSIPQGRVPSYGASQAGAVLRYRLDPDHPHDPHAYARIYRALVDQGESELALGASARPVPALPIRAHAEIRVTEFALGTEARPAAFVTTEFLPVKLPGRMRAESYGQAGYVGGENSTAFADGQLHILRDIHQFDLGKLSVGAGAWGGVQEGAARVDVGPSVRLNVRVGEAPARLSLDYRERVAGNAEPPSGVAITLSTSF